MDKLRLLIRFFFRGFFSGNPGLLFGLLGTPGAILTVVLIQKYSPLAHYGRKQFAFDAAMQSLTDKYLYIAICMTVAGLVAALRAGTLFPDRQDFANLAPLPVDLRQLLTAKAVALTGFLFAVIVSMNVFSSVFFPAIALSHGTFTGFLRFSLAHALALSAAALCMFCTVLAVQGILMSVLPYAWFSRVRRFVQFGWVVALLALLFITGPAMKEMDLVRTGVSTWAVWLPGMWFVGLYQTIQGVPMGTLSDLWPTALKAMSGAVLLAVIAYALSYRWYFLKSAESAGNGLRTIRVPDALFRFLDRTVFRTGFDRACFRFIARTVARSDRPSAAFAGIMGLGVSLAAVAASSGELYGILTASLILVYSLLTALRFAFGIPVDPESMWIFRVTSHPDAEPLKLVKRTLLCFAAIVIVPSAGVLAFTNGPLMAALHLVFSWLATFGLVDILTVGFRAVPFTCAWMPHRNNAVMPLATWIAGLAFFGPGLAGFEKVFLIYPQRVIWVVAFLAAIGWACRRTEEVKEVVAWSDTRGEFEMLRITD